MIQKTYPLPENLAPSIVEDLLIYLPYCAGPGPGRLLTSLQAVGTGIQYACAGEKEAAAVEATIDRLLSLLCVRPGEAAPLSCPGPGPVFENRGAPSPCRAEVFPELLAGGHLFALGPGLYGMGKTFLRVFKYFERACHRLAMEFSPEEYVYPSLLQANPESTGEYICKSAICFHSYQQFAGQTLAQPLILTSQGRCFRDDEGGFPPGRWREFIMREIVFMGEAGFVRAGLTQVRRRTEEWMVQLGLGGAIESADDLFFDPGKRVAPVFRLIPETKLKLRLVTPSGDPLAAASFNFHGPYFSRAFDITGLGSGSSAGKSFPATGCAKFGIERLTYAFLSHYGLDTNLWPLPVREMVLS